MSDKPTRRQWRDMDALYGGDGTVLREIGVKEPAPKRIQGHPERDTLNAIMSLLRQHPKVAWRVRMNSGGFTDGHGQFVRFGFVGCPDIWFQMKGTGQLGCIEVKSPTGQATEAQTFFLERVKQAGGRAGIARSIEDAIKIIES